MANLFNSIRVKPPKMNRFNLSHDVKLTTTFGRLTPILVEDCIPGDIFKCNTEMLTRFMPLKAPIMQNINVYTHFFFVPKRLLWDKWREFITGGEDGKQAPIYPRLVLTSKLDFDISSLADYLGFPVPGPGTALHPDWYGKLELDALPFRAYQLIYNEYYRDQNVEDEVDIGIDLSGPVSDKTKVYPLLQLQNRCWQKDYFTSALPWAQRGDEVELPLQGSADLIYNSDAPRLAVGPADTAFSPSGYPVGNKPVRVNQYGQLVTDDAPIFVASDNKDSPAFIDTNFSTDFLKKVITGVDLSKVSAATINELRRAIKAQEFLEVGARGGSRYIEQIYSYFGVRSSDARLQRPQFLGGGKSPVVISDVLQTSQTSPDSPQATPAGHAISVQNSHSFKFRCEEHGYIIGILSVMPKPSYQQGLSRMFTKFDRLDHYWPQFAHLGEQEIKNSELFVDYSLPPSDLSHKDSDGTFGYTPRYSEYKYASDQVHGDFRGNLAFWHMGRIFDHRPGLNHDFLTSMKGSTDRQFPVTDLDVDNIWIQLHHNIKALRKMPKYGTPMF